MNFTDSDKITILINRLDFHAAEIHRREEKETKLFEWATTYLLALFAVLFTYLGSNPTVEISIFFKLTATLFFSIPIVIVSVKILSERHSIVRQAEVIVQIESILCLFTPDMYNLGTQIYPDSWHGLAQYMGKRKTPITYVVVLFFLLFLTILSIWIFF